MDFLSGLPMMQQKHDCILVVVYRFSKMAIFIPCTKTIDAPQIVELFFEHMWKKFGLPTIEEFKAAEENGIREVLPNMKGNWFWSASLRSPFGSYYARIFSGNSGVSSYVGARDYYDDTVRCVGR